MTEPLPGKLRSPCSCPLSRDPPDTPEQLGPRGTCGRGWAVLLLYQRC